MEEMKTNDKREDKEQLKRGQRMMKERTKNDKREDKE